MYAFSTLADALAAEGLGLEEAAGPSAAERAARAELVSASLQAAETTARLVRSPMSARISRRCRLDANAGRVSSIGHILCRCARGRQQHRKRDPRRRHAARRVPLPRREAAARDGSAGGRHAHRPPIAHVCRLEPVLLRLLGPWRARRLRAITACHRNNHARTADQHGRQAAAASDSEL